MTNSEIASRMHDHGKGINRIAEELNIGTDTVKTLLAAKDRPSESTDFHKGWNKNRNGCRKCMYKGSHVKDNAKHPGCNYILMEGHSRGCPIEDCQVFRKGKK